MKAQYAERQTIDLSKRQRCKHMSTGEPITSVTIRETDGRDAAIARGIAAEQGPAGSVTLELLRLALVEVNGRRVTQPYDDLEDWSPRATEFVMAAFAKLIGVSEDERASFFRENVHEAAAPAPRVARLKPIEGEEEDETSMQG